MTSKTKNFFKVALFLLMILCIFGMLCITLKSESVYAYSNTIVYTSAGTYDISQDNILADCQGLSVWGITTFNIKSNVNTISFLGVADRQMVFKQINVETRSTPLSIFFENMSLSGKADETLLYNPMGATMIISFTGKNYLRGGNRTFHNTDLGETNKFCNAIGGGNIELRGSGDIVIEGGSGLSGNMFNGGFGIFCGNLSVNCNIVVKGGNGGNGKEGHWGADGSAWGNNGENGGAGETAGDGRCAIMVTNLFVNYNCAITATGGNGGNGGAGGKGGNGAAGKNGALFVNPIAGGNGGNGGEGGAWGLSMQAVNWITSETIYGTVNGYKSYSEYKFINNGQQGVGGVGGNGGNGGDGSYSMYGNPKNNQGAGGVGGKGSGTSANGLNGSAGNPRP